MSFGGVEFYPTWSTRRRCSASGWPGHPLPDGNKRVAYLSLHELLARNGIEWTPPSVDETVATIEFVAARARPRELDSPPARVVDHLELDLRSTEAHALERKPVWLFAAYCRASRGISRLTRRSEPCRGF
jgi:hypothetical protein